MYEQLRLSAAREIYEKRDEYTPGKGLKWADWWTAKYGDGETYLEYVRRKTQEKADDARGQR